MKNETKSQIKSLLDKVYDIITVQLIGAVVFILIGLTLKFIGGNLYTSARNMYYSAIDSKISADLVTGGENLISDISSEVPENISSDFLISEPSDEFTEVQSNTGSTITTGSYVNTDKIIWPLAGKITANFGEISYLFSGPDNSHTGIDIAADTGTKILACADGIISFAGYSTGFGNYMIIKHSDSLSTLYAHCSQLLYSKGTDVKKGDVVALVGSTGKATGPHLHLEVLSKGKSVDPLWLLPPISNV